MDVSLPRYLVPWELSTRTNQTIRFFELRAFTPHYQFPFRGNTTSQARSLCKFLRKLLLRQSTRILFGEFAPIFPQFPSSGFPNIQLFESVTSNKKWAYPKRWIQKVEGVIYKRRNSKKKGSTKDEIPKREYPKGYLQSGGNPKRETLSKERIFRKCQEAPIGRRKGVKARGDSNNEP